MLTLKSKKTRTEWLFLSFDGKEYKRVEDDDKRYWLVRADGVIGEFCWQIVAPALEASLEAEFAGRRSPEAVAEFEISFD